MTQNLGLKLALKSNQITREILSSIAVAILLIATLLASIAVEAHYVKRIQYHEQGIEGPKSYKFGFTSGDHKNPQERHEISDGYGHVKGWYSYMDADGKYQVVHYEAHPKYGFSVYNPKHKAYNNGKRHYNS